MDNIWCEPIALDAVLTFIIDILCAVMIGYGPHSSYKFMCACIYVCMCGMFGMVCMCVYVCLFVSQVRP